VKRLISLYDDKIEQAPVRVAFSTPWCQDLQYQAVRSELVWLALAMDMINSCVIRRRCASRENDEVEHRQEFEAVVPASMPYLLID